MVFVLLVETNEWNAREARGINERMLLARQQQMMMSEGLMQRRGGGGYCWLRLSLELQGEAERVKIPFLAD